MFKALWDLFRNYRRQTIEMEIKLLDAEILPVSRKLIDLLARQRELSMRYGREKHVGEELSSDDFIALHADLPLEISWTRQEFERLANRREKLEAKLGGASDQSFLATVA